MSVKGQSDEVGSSWRRGTILPSVGRRVVDLEAVIGVGMLVLAADGEHPAVGQRQQRRIPAAGGHRGAVGPALSRRVEARGFALAGVVAAVVGLVAACREQAPVSQEGVTAAEEVEGAAVAAPDGWRVIEV